MEKKYNSGLLAALVVVCILGSAAGLVSCAPKEPEGQLKPVPTPTVSPTPTPTPTVTPTLTPTPTATPAPTSTPSPAPQKESLIGFYPLKEGSMWEYEGEGMEYASSIQRVVYSSGNRHQLTIDNGGTVIANVIEERTDRIVNTFRSGEAYSNENYLDEPSNLNIIMLLTPLEEGNFWISEENHYQIVDTEADVSVPAGEFEDCIAVKVTFKDQTSNMIYYYKKGIGMVQSEFRTDVGDLITSKLKRYELK